MNGMMKFFEMLLEGSAGRVADLFSAKVSLDDPRAGHIGRKEELADFVEEYPSWLGRGFSEAVALTETDERTVAEFVLHLVHNGEETPLPVAIAADKGGGGFAAIRIYHSMWPLLGRHVVRPPLLGEDKSLVMPDVVGKYHRALADGDLEGILLSFEEDAYAREPAGGPYLYKGAERLRKFYGGLFANGGGIQLEHCSLTDDGIRAALEYNALAWGRTALPPQAGIAVYERGSSGRLHAARIYDDVNPPV